MTDLDRIRRRYELSDGFSLPVPSGDAYVRQPWFVTVYEDALITSLYLPLHPLIRDLLIFLDNAPWQLVPNSWDF